MRTSAGLLLIAMATATAPVAAAREAGSAPDARTMLFAAVFSKDAPDRDAITKPLADAPKAAPNAIGYAPAEPATGPYDLAAPSRRVILGPDWVQDGVMQGLSGLGLHTVSSDTLAERGRWYLFAAASGREVGLNVAGDAWNTLHRLGWSAEGASSLISDAQAGVAWRKGATQASLGYVHRQIGADLAGEAPPGRLSDSMVAFSLSIQPR